MVPITQHLRRHWYGYTALSFIVVLASADAFLSSIHKELQNHSTVVQTALAFTFLFIAYEIIEKEITKKEIRRWDKLAGSMLGELRRAANPLHSHIQLFLEEKNPASFPVKRKGHSRYDKKIRELLPQVLGELSDYRFTLEQHERELVDVMADDVKEFEEVFRGWQDMLFRLEMVRVYDLCHEVLRTSLALQRRIGTGTISAAGVGEGGLIQSWDRYTAARRRLWKEINKTFKEIREREQDPSA